VNYNRIASAVERQNYCETYRVAIRQHQQQQQKKISESDPPQDLELGIRFRTQGHPEYANLQICKIVIEIARCKRGARRGWNEEERGRNCVLSIPTLRAGKPAITQQLM